VPDKTIQSADPPLDSREAVGDWRADLELIRQAAGRLQIDGHRIQLTNRKPLPVTIAWSSLTNCKVVKMAFLVEGYSSQSDLWSAMLWARCVKCPCRPSSRRGAASRCHHLFTAGQCVSSPVLSGDRHARVGYRSSGQKTAIGADIQRSIRLISGRELVGAAISARIQGCLRPHLITNQQGDCALLALPDRKIGYAEFWLILACWVTHSRSVRARNRPNTTPRLTRAIF